MREGAITTSEAGQLMWSANPVLGKKKSSVSADLFGGGLQWARQKSKRCEGNISMSKSALKKENVENILRITGYVINKHEHRNASAGLLGHLIFAILIFSFGHIPKFNVHFTLAHWHRFFTSFFLNFKHSENQNPNMHNIENVCVVSEKCLFYFGKKN